jgi:hypothetical protein
LVRVCLAFIGFSFDCWVVLGQKAPATLHGSG